MPQIHLNAGGKWEILVFAGHFELGRGDIESHGALVEVAGLVDGLHDHRKTRLDVARRREAPFVANKGGITTELALDDSFEIMEHLSVHDRDRDDLDDPRA